MKKIFNTTAYSLLLVALFLGGMVWVSAVDIPLNQAPNSGTTRGQYKSGPLTLGSATVQSTALHVAGSGLTVQGVNCGQSPYSGTWPCPYSPFTANSPSTAEMRILGSGTGIGGYLNSLVVGSPVGTAITGQTALDINGNIVADPGASYLNYANGTLYPNSLTDKPLCALANGDIVVCGTVSNGVCGPANGTTMNTFSYNDPTLCSAGTAGSVNGAVFVPGTYNWSCAGTGGGASPSCSATNSSYSGPIINSGSGNGGTTSGVQQSGGN